MNTVRPEPMKVESLALFCLTPGGVRLAQRLRPLLPQLSTISECFTSENCYSPVSLCLADPLPKRWRRRSNALMHWW